jgi:hypothetical protein
MGFDFGCVPQRMRNDAKRTKHAMILNLLRINQVILTLCLPR